jgi:hypothetical protein
VSWKPFVKSKPSATATTTTSRTVSTKAPLAVPSSGRAGSARASV